MLAKLELKLKAEQEITYPMASLFHGALIEMLPEEYAEYLHLSRQDLPGMMKRLKSSHNPRF